jgi:hypothetical protein
MSLLDGRVQPMTLMCFRMHYHAPLALKYQKFESVCGTLKNHFKIFASQLFFALKTQVKIIIACCALHNWILEDRPDEYVYDDVAWYSALPQGAGGFIVICNRRVNHGHANRMSWLKRCGRIN